MKAHESGSFGELLKKFRSDPTRWDEKPPSQARLAERVYVSVDAIAAYEQNRRFPSPGVFEALVKVLKLTEAEKNELASALHAAKAARRGEIASETAPMSPHPLEHNETVTQVPEDAIGATVRLPEAGIYSGGVTQVPEDATRAIAPLRVERQPINWPVIFETAHRRRVVYYVVIPTCLAMLILLVSMVTLWVPSNIVKPVLVSGNVSCASSEPVEGVWFDVFRDGRVDKGVSGYADPRNPNHNGSEMGFEYVLKGDAYNLHVGCGGSKLHWKGIYITELGSGPVHDDKFHAFICHDLPLAVGYGSCGLQ